MVVVAAVIAVIVVMYSREPTIHGPMFTHTKISRRSSVRHDYAAFESFPSSTVPVRACDCRLCVDTPFYAPRIPPPPQCGYQQCQRIHSVTIYSLTVSCTHHRSITVRASDTRTHATHARYTRTDRMTQYSVIQPVKLHGTNIQNMCASKLRNCTPAR